MRRYPVFTVLSAFPLAALSAIAAIGGIFWPSIYAKESVSWAAQGVGQDWVNLVIIVPFLVVSGSLARKGSRKALLLLGGAQVYTFYSFVLYAFDLHFNALFLVYCTLLGLSFYACVSLAAFLSREKSENWFPSANSVRWSGGLQIAIGFLFGFLWLSEDIPALLKGTAPASLAEVGLMTNPVHVLDLSIILPAFVFSGVMILKRQPAGYFLTPIMLGFGVLMAIAIGGMVYVMSLRGVAVELGVSAIMGVIATTSAAVLIHFLSQLNKSAI